VWSSFEKQITVYSEFSLSANVNDLERIESQTLNGVGIIKLYFHPARERGRGLRASHRSQSGDFAPHAAWCAAAHHSFDTRLILCPIIPDRVEHDTLSESELITYGIPASPATGDH